MVLSGFAEIISLSSVLPFLIALTNPDRLWANPFIYQISQSIGIDEAKGLVFPIAVLFILCAITTACVRLSNLWLNSRLAAAIGSDLSIGVYSRALKQPYSQHLIRNSSSVISTATNEVTETTRVLTLLLKIFTSIFVVFGLLIALFLIDRLTASVSILFFLIAYIYLSLSARKVLLRNSRVNTEANQIQLKILQEGLGSIRDIILDNSYDIYLNIYRSVDRPKRIRQAKNDFLSEFPRYTLEALGLVIIALLALLLLTQKDDISYILPILGTLALGAQRLLPAMQQIYASWATISGYSASIDKVLTILELRNYQNSIWRDITIKKDLILNNSLNLIDLSFKYNKESPLVLNKINLNIKFGKRIGIIGKTGSGKSTLLDVIMGLLPPTSGKLVFGDNNLYDKKSQDLLYKWRRSIAHVPQDIFLSDTTIAENIAFTLEKESIDLERVRLVAKQSQISEYIETLSLGYGTVVGENGVRLSGGQKQRLGIARALYKKSNILVLDEATSALDSITEEKVIQSIEEIGKSDMTVFMIAHRLSTINHCDWVIHMEKGMIKDQGPPSLILKKYRSA